MKPCIIFAIMITMISTLEREWTHENELSEKEKIFLLDYAQTNDMERALRKAGYAESVIGFKGKSILARIEARLELQQIKEELEIADNSLTKEEVIEEFRTIATATITDFYDANGEVIDVTEMDPVKAKAIKEIKRTVNPKSGAVTVVVTMHDKIQALQNLGRIGGHYAADNDQGGGDVNIQIVVPGGLGAI